MKSFRFLLMMAAVSQLFAQAPSFSSSNNTTFELATPGSFTVTTTGSPAPGITESGVLPAGVTFTDNGNGTGTLGGAPGQDGTFPITFTATNGVGLGAVQTFSLIVLAENTPPSFTGGNNTTFEFATPGSFTVTTTGFPAPGIAESGGLPTGVIFTDNGNGTGTLGGTPGQSGTFPITFTATNGVGLGAVQTFNLIVVAKDAPPSFTSANNTTFALGAPGSFIVTTTGFPAPGITESGPLPAGVTFTDNGNGSGTLSGTPHALGPFSVAFTATSGLGTVSQSFTLTVNVGPNLAPSITSGSTKTFVVGAAGSFTVTTNGSPLPMITESGTLPIGVTFTDNGNGTATLSGTPLTGGAFAITFTANNGAGPNAVQNFNLNVNGEAITSTNNATFALGTPGSFIVTTAGSPTSALTESGALPTGVTFTDNGNGTATLSGTPAAGGPFPVAFTAANGVGLNAVQNFILAVNQGPSFTSANNATFVLGAPGSFTVTTTGTPAPAISESGVLPTGMTFTDNDNGTGTLSGTPGNSGIFNIGFDAGNGVGKGAPQLFTLTVNGPNQAPAITSANNATFAVGSPGFFTVTTTGSPLPGITESGALPTGVTFVDNGNGSGTLSGTPSVGGPFIIAFTAANGAGSSATQKFTLTVTGAGNQAPAITSGNATTFSEGAPGLFTVTVSGSPLPGITESGVLPPGVTFTDNGNGTGTLGGTAAQNGTFSISFTAMNGVGFAAVQNFTLTVLGIGNTPPSFTSADNTTFALGTPGSFTVTTNGSPAPGITESGVLPTGVALTDNGNGSGTLSGTPHAPGPFSVVFTATSGLGTVSQSFTLNVNVGPNLAPSITSGNTKTFVVGTAGSFTVTTNGSPLPAITESAPLPIGVTFTDNGNGTATLSGTPVTGGAFPITFTANNGAGPNAVQNFTLNVNGEAITSANNATFALGTPGSFIVTTAGSPTSALTESGALPTGVTFTDNGNGTATLSGTPAAGGPFPVAFTAANGVGLNAVQNFILTVTQGPSFTSANNATFVLGAPGSFTVTTTGTPALPIFEQGALPTGVTFVDNGNGSGTLAGTPGSSGIFSIGFSASNDGGKTSAASQTFTLRVNTGGQAPAITSPNNITFAVGSPGSFTVTTTGSPLPGITESGALPTGVVFIDNGNGSGTLSGTPSVGGPFTIAFTAANGVNPNAVQTFVLSVSQSQTITFTSNAPPNEAYNSSFTVAASASSGLPVAFTASGSCSNVGATYTMTSSTGTCSVIANQAGNSIFPAAPQITQTVNATLAAQTINFAPIGTQTVGVPFPLSATASSGLPVNLGGPAACGGSMSGGVVTPGISGTCTIVATQPGDANYLAATPVSQTFTVNGQPQTITFSAIATQTVGAPLTLTATASSSLAVTYTSSTTGICTVSAATVTFLTGGTCTIVASQAGNTTWAAATSVTQSFTVNQNLQPQTIAFAAIAAKTAGTPLTLTATASSGLPVSFTSSTTGICTVSGTTAALIAGGTCTIIASQAGNTGFSAATPVSQSFTVSLAGQTIVFGPITAQTVPTPLTLTATASSGLPVTYTSSTTGVCTVSPATATFLTVGTCTIVASQAGNAGFSAATPVSQSFTVNLATQTIAFGPIAAQTVPTPLTLTATASSGLPVTYTSSTTGVCTVSPATATFLTVGTCTIVVSQAGNAGYSAATPVSQSFTVNLAAQTIAFGAIATQAGGTLTLTATASSGLPVTYTSSTTGVCTVSSATAVFLTNGTCAIVASQAGNASYAAATSVTQSFLVNLTLQPQSITFAAILGQTVGTQLTLAAAASSGLPVTYTSSTTGVCTVSATTATFLTGGTCTIVASQAGNAAYAPAMSVTQSFLVNLQSQTIAFPPIGTQTVGGPTIALRATASSGLPVTFNLSVGACTLFNGQVTPFAVGTCTIVASQPGNGVYAAATPVSQTFTVIGQTQTITFNPIATQTVGVPLTLTAAASSSLAVTYTSPTTGTCTVSPTTATFLTGGTCTIVASQAGNSSYAAATSMTQSFTVKGNLQPQSITFTTNAPANAAYNTSFTVAASASSGLPVAFTSSGSCTNVGATYTMTSGAGMCSVIANQAGNANFSAAATLTRTVTATLASQTITFPTIPTESGPGTVTLAGTDSSGLPVSYTVNSGPATVSGNLLTTAGAGSVKVTASQAGSTNYSAAAPVSETFTVNANASTLNGKNCNGAYTGTFNGNLTVSAGQTCAFTNGGVNGNLTLAGGSLVLNNNSSINGNLQMSGGSLSISNVTVGGNLQIDGGATFAIGSGVTIGGDLQLTNLTSSAGTDQVCGAKIRGNLQLQNSATAVLIGAATGCAGNQVSGNLQVQNNTASTTIDSNTVSGNLMDQDNTAATQVFTNVITGQLQCSGNSSITGGGNKASGKQGQCSAF